MKLNKKALFNFILLTYTSRNDNNDKKAFS